MEDNWNGYSCENFLFEGRNATVVFPDTPNKERYWTIKTEYQHVFPDIEIKLLKHGFHVTYLENKSRFATKEDCDAKNRFALFLKDKYNLNEKCVPIGMSCGGAHAVNFAGIYPEKVKCIFIDAPVLNFCDFPGRMNDAECERVWEKEFVVAYPGMTRAKLVYFDNHPLVYLDRLKANRIPIILLYGTQDTTVDYEKNGKIMEYEYEDCMELLTVVKREYQGHHPHGGGEGTQDIVVDFILKNCQKI